MHPGIIIGIVITVTLIIGISLWVFLPSSSQPYDSEIPIGDTQGLTERKKEKETEGLIEGEAERKKEKETEGIIEEEEAQFTSNIPSKYIKQKNPVREFNIGSFTITY
jgi:beta-lactam-binding protein with PASTA domain